MEIKYKKLYNCVQAKALQLAGMMDQWKITLAELVEDLALAFSDHSCSRSSETPDPEDLTCSLFCCP